MNENFFAICWFSSGDRRAFVTKGNATLENMCETLGNYAEIYSGSGAVIDKFGNVLKVAEGINE